MSTLWAVQWRSKNKLDGEKRHIIHDHYTPLIFSTKKECSEYISWRYGYIKSRKDLRREPHGYLMPIPVKVKIELTGE